MWTGLDPHQPGPMPFALDFKQRVHLFYFGAGEA